MGVRAVIVVREDTGPQRRFWSGWASKQYQIPHLARFVHTTDEVGLPLSVAGYLAYAATHPDTLPARDITLAGGYGDPNEVGDLDHRYELLLCPSARSVRYLVYDRNRDRYGEKPSWRRSEDLGTRAVLYQAAARMCRELVVSTERYLAAGNRSIPSGWPTAQHWRDDGQQFVEWLAESDHQLLHRRGPTAGPVPQWYALGVARAQVRQINTVLRKQFPGMSIRTRVAADGTVSLTVPAVLATGTNTAWITQALSSLLGCAFTASARTHRPSRYTIHSGSTGSPAAAYVTLTLQPHDAAAVPDPAPPRRADEDDAGR